MLLIIDAKVDFFFCRLDYSFSLPYAVPKPIFIFIAEDKNYFIKLKNTITAMSSAKHKALG